MTKNKYNDERVRNFYYLLAYAFENDRIHFEKEDLFGKEKFNNIYDLFAIVLYISTNELIKEGINSEYINYNEQLQFIKGRIDIVSTMRYNTIQIKNNIICNYDSYCVNNLLNQIIKSTISNLLKMDIIDANKVKLRQLYYDFVNIDVINDLKTVKWKDIKFNRLNNRYKIVIKICEYILENLIINKDEKSDIFQSFDDDQAYHELFEKFIRNYLNIYYKEYKRRSPANIEIKTETMKWNIDEDKKIVNRKYIPLMHTDITLKKDSNVKIIDTKFYKNIITSVGFKGYKKESINRDNWYQINSYVLNKKYELGKNANVSGMLLYAQTDEERFADFEVDLYIMGNRIQVKTINLSKEFGNPYKPQKNTIAWQMQQLAEQILEELE